MIQAEYVRIDGALAYVEQAGEGRPVLCIHTAGQSGVQWRHTLGDLAKLGYRVIVPDLPGHGRSEPASGGVVQDLGIYARWCESLIEQLELKNPLIVGCSIGGKIALDLASRMGDRVAGAVAMAADAVSSGLNVKALRRELEDAAAPSRSDRTYLGTLAVVGRSVPMERARLIANMHRREDPLVSTSDLIGWSTHDLRPALSWITCPTYLVIGEDDLWLDLDGARWTVQQIQRSRFELLEGVGHYPMEEIDGFADLLHRWLTELLADGETTATRLGPQANNINTNY